MKPIWKGSISFGLVNIPVKLYSAIESKSGVNFRLLHKKDKAPIKYKRFCAKEDKEVEWNDIIRAVELSKGEYYPVPKEELEKLKPKKSENIEIVEFTDINQLDPIYYNNHYFLAPHKERDRAFFLFKNVLQSTNKVAIGRFIMRDKEYTCSLFSYKKGIMLITLNYEYEIRNINQIPELKEIPDLRKEEIALATNLIDQLYNEELDLSQYKDTFKEQLSRLLKQKEKGKIVKEPVIKKTPEKNLIKALKASLR